MLEDIGTKKYTSKILGLTPPLTAHCGEDGNRLADDTTWKVGNRYIAWCEEYEVWCRAVGFSDSELSVLDSNNYRFDGNGNRYVDDTTWKVESRCIARWEDGVWYRAEVKKVQRDGVLVSFIDYGNSATVSEVVNLFSEIPQSDEYDKNVISCGGGMLPL